MKKTFITLLFSFIWIVSVLAQPSMSFIKVTVTPDHTDWLYKCGEKPKFAVEVTTCSNAPVENAQISYEISEDLLAPIKKGSMVLKDGKTVLSGYTMNKPGFLRCRVWVKINGKEYEECATAGFDVERIKPKTVMPDDFSAFWQKALEDNAKIEMQPKLTLVPERCTPKVNVYLASFQNYKQGSYIYGTLCVPANLNAGDKCPAILIVPGAGCRPRKGFYKEAEKGFVTFEISIHGISTLLEPDIYENLSKGALNNYPFSGIDDKDNYFYKRVYVGCARAIDFLAQLDFVDAERIGVTGGSQGGALAITTACLNPKVKCLAVLYPAMCDLTGYLHGQGNSWPYLFENKKMATPERLNTVQYYDVVNFVRNLKKQKVFVTFGYNDMVVCPTSVQGACNEMRVPKELMIVPQSRHYVYPEQAEARSAWMMKNLSKNNQ